ncbi:MAG: ribulose-phosphate 3-epimerase [Candidatus Omnitrophota bacterium]
MKKNILVAPSILSADFSKLKEEIKKIELSGADMIHIDVMDGQLVPNITIGPLVVEAVKKHTSLPLDTHLMIEEPHKLVGSFASAGSDIITVHAEAYPKNRDTGYGIRDTEMKKGVSRSITSINETKLKEVLLKIRGLGKKAGVSLNPDSPFCIKNILNEADMILIMSVHPGFGGQKFIESVLPKIREARKSYSGDIQVDGGINDKNVKLVIDAGANIIVAGSYFFSAKDPKDAIKKLRSSNS